VEKPFGRDLATAKELNKKCSAYSKSTSLPASITTFGKDTVQNLLVLRFASIFRATLDRNYVDHVQITAGETLGVERRGGFYETAGPCAT